MLKGNSLIKFVEKTVVSHGFDKLLGSEKISSETETSPLLDKKEQKRFFMFAFVLLFATFIVNYNLLFNNLKKKKLQIKLILKLTVNLFI